MTVCFRLNDVMIDSEHSMYIIQLDFVQSLHFFTGIHDDKENNNFIRCGARASDWIALKQPEKKHDNKMNRSGPRLPFTK